MQEAFKARIIDDQIEWIDTAPAIEGATVVQVIIGPDTPMHPLSPALDRHGHYGYKVTLDGPMM